MATDNRPRTIYVVYLKEIVDGFKRIPRETYRTESSGMASMKYNEWLLDYADKEKHFVELGMWDLSGAYRTLKEHKF